MPAKIIQLRPKARQPAPESFGDYLRRLADEFEGGEIAGVSVIVTTWDGNVMTFEDTSERASRI